jgi:hypothetical protein
MRRSARLGCALACVLLQETAGHAAALDPRDGWVSELPAAASVRRTVKGADAGPRLEAAFATLCDYVDVRNGGSNPMPRRVHALRVEYRCQNLRVHPVSIKAGRYFDSPAFRRELLTSFISTASFDLYAAQSPTMRNMKPRIDRE